MGDIARSANYLTKYDTLGYTFNASFAHSAVHRDVIMQAYDYAEGVTVRNYLIKVPEGVFPHLVYSVACEEAAQVQFFEGATVSADGTEIIQARLNRNSSRTIQTGTFHSPTITDDGTELPGGYVPGGNGASNPGATVALHDDAEWLLKDNTNYIVRITASNSNTAVRFEWYE